MLGDVLLFDLIDELANYTEELAVYGFLFDVSEVGFKNLDTYHQYVLKSVRILLMLVKLENIEEGKNGIDPSVVVNIDTIKWVVVYACVLQYFPMIFTCDLIYNFLLLVFGDDERTVQEENLSDFIPIGREQFIKICPTIYTVFLPMMDFISGDKCDIYFPVKVSSDAQFFNAMVHARGWNRKVANFVGFSF